MSSFLIIIKMQLSRNSDSPLGHVEPQPSFEENKNLDTVRHIQQPQHPLSSEETTPVVH
jgi:hypothetical protein